LALLCGRKGPEGCLDDAGGPVGADGIGLALFKGRAGASLVSGGVSDKKGSSTCAEAGDVIIRNEIQTKAHKYADIMVLTL